MEEVARGDDLFFHSTNFLSASLNLRSRLYAGRCASLLAGDPYNQFPCSPRRPQVSAIRSVFASSFSHFWTSLSKNDIAVAIGKSLPRAWLGHPWPHCHIVLRGPMGLDAKGPYQVSAISSVFASSFSFRSWGFIRPWSTVIFVPPCTKMTSGNRSEDRFPGLARTSCPHDLSASMARRESHENSGFSY
jgi:hypothetical protein